MGKKRKGKKGRNDMTELQLIDREAEPTPAQQAIAAELFRKHASVSFAGPGAEPPPGVLQHYTLAGNGIFLTTTGKLANICGKVADVKFSALPDLVEGIDRHVPKLPWPTLQQVWAFFREVYEEHKSEAYCQVLYQPDTQEWRIIVPLQDVSGGGVDHISIRGHREIQGLTWLHVWDIHSHANIGAFWSATDDADEKRSERFYGVIGKLAEPTPELKVRVSNGLGTFLDMSLNTMVDMPKIRLTVEADVGDMLSGKGLTRGDLLEGVTIPAGWMTMVKKHEPVKAITGFVPSGHYGVGSFNPTHRVPVTDKRRFAALDDFHELSRGEDVDEVRRRWGLMGEK